VRFLGADALSARSRRTFDSAAFAASFENGWAAYKDAGGHLAACGLAKRPGEIEYEAYGDGHTATQTNKLKESSDDIFSYVLTWIDTGNEKGWTFHYRPKHPPVSPEVGAALALIGGFNQFPECPQFDFEPCYWRFVRKRDQDRRSIWDEQLGYVHTQFDAHSTRFSPGLQLLLTAHAAMTPFGMSLIKISSQSQATAPGSEVVRPTERRRVSASNRTGSYQYDVAISFAGSERSLAEELAKRLKDAGRSVFYDRFYPEQLWGKDLPAIFDRIYRKDSRFCVIFASKEYAEREWTYFERRSAVARAVAERGREYILPIEVEPVDLDGIPPTIGYLSLKTYSIEKIADLLLKKLASP
jgi:TIR domain